MTFTVTLDNDVQGGLKVTPSFSGTATQGSDYTAPTIVLTFVGTAGESHSFTIDTQEDDTVEGNETFTVSLSISDAPPGVLSANSRIARRPRSSRASRRCLP